MEGRVTPRKRPRTNGHMQQTPRRERMLRLAALIARSTDRLLVGMLGEWLALRHLSRNGYLILERNWRLRRGEIDIVAAKCGTLVFVEVKCRTTPDFSPFDAIGPVKQERLKRLADSFRRAHRARLSFMRIRRTRFDSIGVYLTGAKLRSGRRFFEIVHKVGAFD